LDLIRASETAEYDELTSLHDFREARETGKALFEKGVKESE
jgi:hypothetical protein